MNDTIAIQDRREIPFAMLEFQVIDDLELDPYAFKLYAVLIRLGWRSEDGTTTVKTTRTKLAEAVGCGVTKLDSAIEALELQGYISRAPQFKRGLRQLNEYIVFGPQGAKERIDDAKARIDASKADYSERFVKGKNKVEAEGIAPDQPETQVMQPVKRATEKHAARQTSNGSRCPLNGLSLPAKRAGKILDSKDLDYKTPIVPFEVSKDEKPRDEKTRNLMAHISKAFPRARAPEQTIVDAIERWNDQYGIHNTSVEIQKALCWYRDNNKHYRDPVKFLGNWLRRAYPNPVNVELQEKINAAYEDLWAAWPGVRDGKEGGRRVFAERLSTLSSDAARNKALEFIAIAVMDLGQRVSAGQYPPSIKNWLRDADFGEAHSA